MAVCEVSTGTAKWTYLFFFTLTVIASWVLRDYSAGGLAYIHHLQSCQSEATVDEQHRCLGKGAVLRISFGNFIFFAAHFLLLLGVTKQSNFRRYFHSGLWPLQLLAWAALLGMTFALPNHVFYVWGQAARVLSGFFLVLQIIILVEFMYIVNEYLLERDENSCARFTLVLGSLALFVISLGIIGATYYLYAPHGSCHLNIFFITWTLIMGIVLTAISVSPWRVQHAGLLTAGSVFAYMAYLVWAALSSELAPDRCIRGDGTSGTGIKVVGFVLAIAATLYATLNSSMASKTLSLSESSALDDSELLPYRPDFFHAVFMLASAYVAMLFTSWSLTNVSGAFTVDHGWISVWVKMASQWLCALLYGWTLIAPAILKNRQF